MKINKWRGPSKAGVVGKETMNNNKRGREYLIGLLELKYFAIWFSPKPVFCLNMENQVGQ